MNELFTQIDILRHGECVGGDIFRGVTDVELTDKGWQQMHHAVRHLSRPDRIITSPLKRCQRFASQHAQQHKLPLTINESWREINFGIWDGQRIADVREQESATLDRYYSEPGSVTPEGGESLLEVRARVINAWQQTLEQFPNEHLLIVQHGGTMRLLLSYLLDAPLTTANRIEIGYAHLTRIKVYHDNGRHFPVLISHTPGPNLESDLHFNFGTDL